MTTRGGSTMHGGQMQADGKGFECAQKAIGGVRRRYVPSGLLGRDFFALSFGLDMIDVGGFVVAAAIVVVEMTSTGDL